MKTEVQEYKKSIYDLGLPHEQEAIIWDFYVSKAIAKSASQKRTAADYGLNKLPWDEMKRVAALSPDSIKVLLADSINKTLADYDLVIIEGKGENKKNKSIDVDTPRIVCNTPYSIADEDAPKASVGEAESVLTHIRNSFAHGNTYFFPNNMMLIEDRDQRGGITARMVLKVQTLLDWIMLIDRTPKFYILHKSEEN